MRQNKISIRLKNLFISLAIFVALVLYASTYAEPVLRVSFLPDESPSMLRRKSKPLIDYLEKKIGMKIEFRPMRDGDALVQALLSKKMDMVWLDGFNFIQAQLQSNEHVIPLVQRAEDEKTHSVFITTQGGIRRLQDLKGKTLAFGAETSASSYWMPRVYLLAAQINPDFDITHVFSGAPDAIVAAVMNGEADAGALNSASWEKLIEQGKVDPQAVHVFYTTPGYSDYNWTVRADMDINLRQKLTDAFLALDRRNGPDKEILDLQQASKFIPTQVENYSSIVAEMRRARPPLN
jgi:phosphonate transport system substrate-binding protein